MTKDEVNEMIKKYNRYKLELRQYISEKKLQEIRIKKVSLEPRITSVYGGGSLNNKISDETGTTAMKNISIKENIRKDLLKLEQKINECKLHIIECEKVLNNLTEKEKLVLIARINNPDNTYDDIGRVDYYKEFGETRSDEWVRKKITSAYRKLRNL